MDQDTAKPAAEKTRRTFAVDPIRLIFRDATPISARAENVARIAELKKVRGAIASEVSTSGYNSSSGNDFTGDPRVVEAALRRQYPDHSVTRTGGIVKTFNGEGVCFVVRPVAKVEEPDEEVVATSEEPAFEAAQEPTADAPPAPTA